MQETVNTITMSGETMEVFIGAGCLSDCRPGTAVRLPGIISDLCKTLSRRSVARTFINHIRIGDTVALIDRRNNCTFRLQVNAHSVCVLGIRYNTVPPKNLLSGRHQAAPAGPPAEDGRWRHDDWLQDHFARAGDRSGGYPHRFPAQRDQRFRCRFGRRPSHHFGGREGLWGHPP